MDGWPAVVSRHASSRSCGAASVAIARISPDQPPSVILLDHEETVRLLDQGEHGGGVDWAQAAQIDHLGVDALVGQRLRTGETVLDGLHRGHDRQVVAAAMHRSLAQLPHLWRSSSPLVE